MDDPELFFSAILPEDRVKLIDTKKRSASDNIKIDVEFRVSFNNDSLDWLHITAFPSQVNSKRIWNGVLLNINERKQQEFALSKAKVAAEQADKSKSRFLAMMSHEIRTPLSGIIGMIELFSFSALTKSQKNDLNAIDNSANNLLHILNDVLDHSKMETGEFSVENIECDLLDLSESVIKNHAHTAISKGLSLYLDFDANLKNTVFTDPMRLLQILNNLLSNAIKFTNSGTVEISLKQIHLDQAEQTISFSVKDSGIGISPSDQRKLFTPFVQAQDSTSRQYGGTGLGLSISQMLAKRLGGDIKINSVLGKGTEMTFNLTLAFHGDIYTPKLQQTLPIVLIDKNNNVSNTIKNYFDIWQIPLVCLPINPNNISGFKAILPQGKCIFLCDELVVSEHSLKQFNNKSVWIELSKRNFSAEPGQFIISIAPMLITSLVETINQAQYGNNESLYEIISFDEVIPGEQTSREQAEEQGRLILVAEDHPTNTMVIKRQLQKLNYHADFVEDGLQALDAISKNNYGLLLTDCHMPHLDGYELTKQLREASNSIPIIALTANALTGESEHCTSLGMDDFLTKPVSITLLKQVIERFCPDSLTFEFNDTASDQLDSIIEDDELEDALQDILDAGQDHCENNFDLPCENDLPHASTTKMVHTDFDNIIDIEQLFEMFGDIDVINTLLNDFIDTTDHSIAQITHLLKQQNLEEIALLAHRVKGAASMITANQLKHVCQLLEHACKKDDGQCLQASFDKVTEEFSIFQTNYSAALAQFSSVLTQAR